MAKKKPHGKKHKLIIYRKLAFRLGGIPFLLIIFSGVLIGIAFIGNFGFLDEIGNPELLDLLWENRLLLMIMGGFSIFLYIVILIIGRSSHVQARAKSLRVSAGFYTMDISYRRILNIRSVGFESEWAGKGLKGVDRALANSIGGRTCTQVELKSWPMKPGLVRLLWHKFMFYGGDKGLMLIVSDPLNLNNEIDSRRTRVQLASKQVGYEDPIERAARMGNKR